MVHMAFEPDMVVVSTDSPRTLLVVKTGTESQANVEEQLKAYMASVNSPSGLFVTPERIRIYRHTYASHTPGAVVVVADLAATDLLGVSHMPVRGLDFERFVQGWLERLQARTEQIPDDSRQLIEENILPALDSGVVRAARPNRRRIAS